MKTHVGSLQRKGKRYYLVLTANGRQKWHPLMTTRLSTARVRAACIAPADYDGEAAWLTKLVSLGRWANAQLELRRQRNVITWDNLWDTFVTRLREGIPSASISSYRRWIDILENLASPCQPSMLTDAHIRTIAANLRLRFVSAGRMMRFFARVWNTVGWDCSHWREEARIRLHTTSAPKNEHYRRLTLNEVRSVVHYLSVSESETAHEYADMVVIGFYTGLRLSDVAELEISEIAPDAQSLSVIPNKVRTKKPYPLNIPLAEPARTRISARMSNLFEQRFLFSPQSRNRPTRYISRAFHHCGILKQGNGRAGFHSLRATFISLMDEADVPPHITDVITGHASGGMHARYTQPSFSACRQAIERAIPAL